jgi:hypothetical protein
MANGDESGVTEWAALCGGCAKETGLDDEAHMQPPPGSTDMACMHCGAVLAGFWFRVPADAYSGMAPGAG